MSANRNMFEELKQRNGCNLSQEQIAIRMKLPELCNRNTGSYGDIVNKFETGVTKSWDVIKFFRYAHAIKCDADEVFAVRYPEEPYSKLFFEKQKENTRGEQFMDKIIDAVNKGNNAFVITEDEKLFFEIKECAEANRYTVINIGAPWDRGVDWFSSVDEPQAITMFVNSLASFVFDEYSAQREEFENMARKIIGSYIWGNWKGEGYTINGLKKYLLSPQDLMEKYNKDMRMELLYALSFINSKGDKIFSGIFHEKHIILHKITEASNEIETFFVLENYMRILENIKGWGPRNPFFPKGTPDTVFMIKEQFVREIKDWHKHYSDYDEFKKYYNSIYYPEAV